MPVYSQCRLVLDSGRSVVRDHYLLGASLLPDNVTQDQEPIERLTRALLTPLKCLVSIDCPRDGIVKA